MHIIESSQDSFNQKMEIVIRNIKEGKVVIDSGYYTEAAMKTELKFDKQLPMHNRSCFDLLHAELYAIIIMCARDTAPAQGPSESHHRILHRNQSSPPGFDKACLVVFRA